VLEKKLQDKVVELSNTAESLLKCELDLREAARREMDLKDELSRMRETLNNMEVELKQKLAIGTTRIDVLETALRERDQEMNNLSMQLQRSQFDLDAKEVIIKQGLDREKIQDEKSSQIQRTAAEQVNKISDLEKQLEKQLEITKRIPALQKEVETVNDMAKQKQDDLLKTLNAIEANATELSKEVERQKKVDSMLFEAREREAKQIQELANCKINIKMLKDSLQSKDAEIDILRIFERFMLAPGSPQACGRQGMAS
jgi:chromosome segregation ATPase